MLDACAACKFYSPMPKGKSGSCLRYPPKQDGFPRTYPEAWCGEFAPAPKPEAPQEK